MRERERDGNAVDGHGNDANKHEDDNGKAVKTEGKDAVAAWRERCRREPDYYRIDKRATRHLRYKAVDVHVKLTPEVIS